MVNWSIEQINAMAPDSSSASAGRGLAAQKHWVLLGGNENALWGECLGSGSKPYQVQVDLSEPAFKCSCPSRKFPCKHGLGLLLLWANQGHSLPADQPPEWVTEWLNKRSERAETKEKKVEAAGPESEARARAGQEKRAQEREIRVTSGLNELERWLHDLVRDGLASAQSRPTKYWTDIAARMVDSQAPGIARQLREMAFIPASGEGWAGRLLERISRLWLLIEGYRRIEDQPPLMQATIRSYIGWTVKQEELLMENGIRAQWLVVGRQVEEEEKVLSQRTWLLSKEGSAQLLHFAMKGQGFEISPVPGTLMDAELVYFPSSLPQRALIKNLFWDSNSGPQIRCHTSFNAYLKSFSQDLAADPWIDSHLIAINNVTPAVSGRGAVLIDANGLTVKVSPNHRKAWQLIAAGGGRPLTLFGEWNGRHIAPLSIMAGGRFIDLSDTSGLRQ